MCQSDNTNLGKQFVKCVIAILRIPRIQAILLTVLFTQLLRYFI